MAISDTDRRFLARTVELAEEALAIGDEPYGSILVSEDGEVLFEDHNRVSGGDKTQHPEFAIARWAAANLTPEQRERAVVYTSGEHCPMCAAAHGFVGLGRIVYVSSSAQRREWLAHTNPKPSRVAGLAIQEVVPEAIVDGPEPELAERVRELMLTKYGGGAEPAKG